MLAENSVSSVPNQTGSRKAALVWYCLPLTLESVPVSPPLPPSSSRFGEGQLLKVVKEACVMEPLRSSSRTESLGTGEMFTLSLFSSALQSHECGKEKKSPSTCSFYLTWLILPFFKCFHLSSRRCYIMYCSADILGIFFLAGSFFIMNLCYVSAPFFVVVSLKTKHTNRISDLDPHF